MKKYIKPTMDGQLFAANEFVSACGDSGKVYYFECTAKGGPLYARDADGLGYSGASYSPCSKKHEAPVTDAFVNGYIDYNKNKKQDDGEEVIVWLEYGYDRDWWTGETEKYVKNGHATGNLDMDSWEVAKS